ncbi:WYL domain-containing protein [Bacillus sp. IITD106]|nr:WYL domain-containing protein [Bacillus sp. IITD106]
MTKCFHAEKFYRDWFHDPLAETEYGNFHPMVDLTLQLQPATAHRVYDEFDESNIRKNGDGSFTVTVTYPEDEWVYILSFGDSAEVIEPERVRDKIKARLEKMLLKYGSKEK